MSDHIAIMNKGMIEQIGTPEEIYHKPKTIFVAGFIGSPPMNFIDCSLVSVKDRLILDAGTFTIDLPDYMEKELRRSASHKELILGVRPENIVINSGDTIRARVIAIEPLGARNYVTLEIGDFNIKAEVDPNLRLGIGEEVNIGFIKEKMHIFDKKSGNVII